MITHGTATAYRRGCHCPDCCLAHAEAKRAYRARKKSGERFWLSPEKSLRRIHYLMSHGMTTRDIARSAGLNPRAVSDIRRGVSQHVRATTQEALLGVGIDEGRSRPAWRVRIMVGHMQKSGYGTRDIANMAKLHHTTLRRALSADTCSPSTEERLTVLFKLLARRMTVPADVLEDIA